MMVELWMAKRDIVEEDGNNLEDTMGYENISKM